MTEATKNCPACGEEILAVARKCRFCHTYLDPTARPMAFTPNALDMAIMPVGRPASAIASGYLALFAIIPLFGLIPAILAVIFGIMALKAIKKDPSLHGKGRAWFGIIIGGLVCVVTAIGLIGLAIAAMMGAKF